MHLDFDLTEIVLKHNVPTWSFRDHVGTSSSRFDAWLLLSVVPNIESASKVQVQIEEIRQKLPKLGPLTKALQIHENMITSDGEVRSKNLPSDVFYENVKVKESRRIRRVDQDDDIWYTRPHDRSCIAVLKSINFILIPWIDLFGQYHVGTWQNIKFLVSKTSANNLIYFKW